MSFKKRAVVSNSVPRASSSTLSGSTFAFKAKKNIPIGTRLSPYNGQLLISTGVPSLDDILCGGIPLGSLFLIFEDRNTDYAKLLLKYFITEGLAHENRVLVASADEEPQTLVKGCMWLSCDDDDMDNVRKEGSDNYGMKKEERNHDKNDENDGREEEGEGDKMKIAWRYKGLKKLGAQVPVPPSIQNKKISLDKLPSSQEDQSTQPFCHTFDLTKRIPEKIINAASLSFIDVIEVLNADESNLYEKLFNEIKKILKEDNKQASLSDEQATSQNVLRIAIQSVASPMWPIAASSQEVYRFFHALRGLLRSTNNVAVMTIPAHLYIHSAGGVSPSISSIPFMKRIAHVCDAVVGIESFAGSPQTSNSIYTSQYNGLFHVHKLPTINSLLAPATKLSILSGGGGDQLGFKLRRKRFSIEKFHLPPEGGVGERRTMASGGDDGEVENAHK
ncbi:8521_t:CDS:2, partial [Ambispora leptoticha]